MLGLVGTNPCPRAQGPNPAKNVFLAVFEPGTLPNGSGRPPRAGGADSQVKQLVPGPNHGFLARSLDLERVLGPMGPWARTRDPTLGPGPWGPDQGPGPWDPDLGQDLGALGPWDPARDPTLGPGTIGPDPGPRTLGPYIGPGPQAPRAQPKPLLLQTPLIGEPDQDLGSRNETQDIGPR